MDVPSQGLLTDMLITAGYNLSQQYNNNNKLRNLCHLIGLYVRTSGTGVKFIIFSMKCNGELLGERPHTNQLELRKHSPSFFL